MQLLREIYVQLPAELRVKHPGKCWLLNRCLYGTRDAPSNWENLYIEQLEKLGFRSGTASACCFYNKELNARCVVHGDDFTFIGSEEALNIIETGMSKLFMCKIEGRLGDGPKGLREIRS